VHRFGQRRDGLHRSSAYLRVVGPRLHPGDRPRLHTPVSAVVEERRDNRAKMLEDCLQILNKGLKSIRPHCRALMLARSHGRPCLRARCLPTSRSDSALAGRGGFARPLPFSDALAAMPCPLIDPPAAASFIGIREERRTIGFCKESRHALIKASSYCFCGNTIACLFEYVWPHRIASLGIP
jgi:hypothetical protein